MTDTNFLAGDELRRRRAALGLDRAEFAHACGLRGKRLSLQVTMSQYETGQRAVPRYMALLLECFEQGARPSTWPTDDD